MPLGYTIYPDLQLLLIRGHGVTTHDEMVRAMLAWLHDPDYPACIDALYKASQAGVEVDVIVRSICSVWPGLAEVSDRIRIRSIVGEFLEHSRIFGFHNGGDQEWYIGSADLMERNLDRRVEAVVPVEDPEARARIEQIVSTMLNDDRRSWQLGADATWRRTEEIDGAPGTCDTFAVLKEAALASGVSASSARRPRSGAGSLDPRA